MNLLCSLLLLANTAAGPAESFCQDYHRNRAGAVLIDEGPTQYIVVPQGAGVSEAMAQLPDHGTICLTGAPVAGGVEGVHFYFAQTLEAKPR